MENKENETNIVYQTFASIFFIRIGEIVSNLIFVFLFSLFLKAFLLSIYYFFRVDVLLFFFKETTLPFEEKRHIALIRIGICYLISYLLIILIYRKNVINSFFYITALTIHSLFFYITLIALCMVPKLQEGMLYAIIMASLKVVLAFPIFYLVRINLNDQPETASTFCDIVMTFFLLNTV